jgi:glucose/arabinose dehydrogenase
VALHDRLHVAPTARERKWYHPAMRAVVVLVAALGVAGVSVTSCVGDLGNEGSGPGSGPSGNATTGSAAQGSGGAGSGSNGSNSSSSSAGGSTPDDYDCTPGSGSAPAITLTEIEGDFSSPILVRSAPGDPDTLYVVEQTGAIKVVQNGTTLDDDFLDVSAEIRFGGEEGLLGLAFHPDYADNGRFFIHYSQAGDGASTVYEYARSSNPLVAEEEGVRLVLQHPTVATNHNGGSIEFGPDDFLYIAIGDGGSPQGDPECDAQDPSADNLLGKIMRLDVDGTPTEDGYPAADGNPNGAKYYHIGLRNPFRMSFDVCTGDLYIGDVGGGAREEINFLEAADGPQNMGWPWFEGLTDGPQGEAACGTEPVGPREPIEDYLREGSEGGYAVMGGVVHRSADAPTLRGYYFYGDYGIGEVMMFRVENGVMVDGPIETGQELGNQSITSFGLDGHGNVYVVDHAGIVYRIDPG